MPYDILDKIKDPQDLRSLKISDLSKLSDEIRTEIIRVLSINGGHLASNLGIVELTVALHAVFNSPSDKFIFDTSHQTYTHKILTGRKDQFSTLRKYRGICGFSHPGESDHDPFFSGHAGTAFSLGLGVARNRDLAGRQEHVIPIIGDASLTCGLTFEAMNNIPKDLDRFIIILNDNKMAISKNVGNIKNILSRLLNNPASNKIYQEIQSLLAKIPAYGNLLATQGQKITESIKNLVSPAPFFEQFGLTYVGPINGHDLKKLIPTLRALKNGSKPVIVHVITEKGKGMEIAKLNPTPYHGVKPFDIQSGKFISSPFPKPTFPQIFGKHLLKMGQNDPSLVVITPAMEEGSCLSPFKNQFPNRFHDVGIAEEHALTFGGGLAYGGKMKVIISIYSTFLQRAFDNLFHDICLQKNPVILAIDRASLNGPDGTSHHGIYDIGFLYAMPNMIISQPRNGQVLKELLESAPLYGKPTAIRYPNLPTTESDLPLNPRKPGRAEILKEGKDLLIISLGHMFETAIEVGKLLEMQGISPTIVDPVFIKPLDSNLFYELLSSHRYVVTIEEHSLNFGFGSVFNNFVVQNGFGHLQVLNFGIPDAFVEHGSSEELKKDLKLDPLGISNTILQRFEVNHQQMGVSR